MTETGTALVLVSVALVSATELVAQAPDSLWLSGTVVDAEGLVVSGAVVRLDPDGLAVRTDSLGRFRIRVAAGPSTLLVRRLGLAPFSAPLDLRGGVDRRFRIEMASVPRLLETVITEARPGYMPAGVPSALDDFYRRRGEGKGRTFTRDELQTAGGASRALATVPGVRVVSDAAGRLIGLRVPRCGLGNDTAESSLVAWFLDGNRVGEPPMLADSDIEAIEVYRGSSSLPAEAIGNACAAVFVWTRRQP